MKNKLTDGTKQKLLIYSCATILVISLDQITKFLILLNIGLNNSQSFIPGLIQFRVVQNTGGAFSILNDYPLFFKIVGILNILVFLYLTFCPTILLNDVTKIGCAFILGSTVGNLADRLFRNGVIDFIDIELFRFAIFNFADVFINIGVGMILIGLFLDKQSKVKITKTETT